jgi:hypothetical protein
MTYIVLAGGYWFASREFGPQVDRDAGDTERMADYIIRIDNLPPDFLAPLSVKDHVIHHCTQCDRDISEGEMEFKFGCFGHTKTTRKISTEQWDSDALERYVPAPRKWQGDFFRIWVNRGKGLDIWRAIHTYVSGINPTKVTPQPVRVGDTSGWNVDEADVPRVVIATPQATQAQTQNNNTIKAVSK